MVEIWGQTQSSSTTPGHDKTIEAKALAMAYTGKYRYITLQRSWRTATGRLSESKLMPDLIGVRHDGRVDAVEVESKTDKTEDLEARLEEGMRTLPEQHRGDTEVIRADPSMKGGVLSK